MKTLLKITFIALVAISLTRCDTLNTLSLAGHSVGGNIEGKSYAYDYETDLTSKSELLSACSVAGTQLGYTIESQTPEMISWKAGESNHLQEYFGKYSYASLFAAVMSNEEKSKQTLRIGSNVGGNYSEAQKAKVDSIVSGFETKLRSNLQESGYYLKKLE